MTQFWIYHLLSPMRKYRQTTPVIQQLSFLSHPRSTTHKTNPNAHACIDLPYVSAIYAAYVPHARSTETIKRACATQDILASAVKMWAPWNMEPHHRIWFFFFQIMCSPTCRFPDRGHNKMAGKRKWFEYDSFSLLTLKGHVVFLNIEFYIARMRRQSSIRGSNCDVVWHR